MALHVWCSELGDVIDGLLSVKILSLYPIGNLGEIEARYPAEMEELR